MKRMVLVVVSTAITLVAVFPVYAGKRYAPAFYDYADVIEVKPVVELLRVTSPRHEFHEEEHVVGYQVKYRYGDRIYHSRIGHNSGDQIRVRVHVESAE